MRGFRLHIEPVDTERYGLRLEETNGFPHHATDAARIQPDQLEALLPAVRIALRESGHQPTVVAPNRRAPVVLDEAAGVRLALAATAAAPLKKPIRRHSVLEGVASMSDEEAYYWYSKTAQPNSGARALRALRILLVDDGRSGITS
jgi:hypothetical protein